MCGIAAVVFHPEQRTPARWHFIKSYFTQNFLFNQARGEDAAGVAVIQADGRAHILKHPVAASELVKTDDYRAILDKVGPETVLLLGHTRTPTKGAPENNANNHPIQTAFTVGVHNGHIRNDDALFADYGWPRRGEVDSEAIFRLLEMAAPTEDPAAYAAALRAQARQLKGKFTTISVDLRRPTRVVVMKYNRPLCIHFDDQDHLSYFSSRYIFLRKTFGRQVIAEALKSDTVYLFDATCVGKPVTIALDLSNGKAPH